MASVYKSSKHAFKYVSGLGNHMKSEALPGALPLYQNTPQKNSYNLFSEILSGSAFTAPRDSNRSTVLYRMYPTVIHTFHDFVRVPSISDIKVEGSMDYSHYLRSIYTHASVSERISLWTSGAESGVYDHPIPPIQLRWSPLSVYTPPAPPSEEVSAESTSPPSENSNFPVSGVNFVEGITTMSSCGSPLSSSGGSFSVYNFNEEMRDTFIANHDAEMLIIPYDGILQINTELGNMTVEPLEIACIPRSLKFQVIPLDKQYTTLPPQAKQSIYDGICIQENLIHKNTHTHTHTHTPFYSGYICENYGTPFKLPELGPIGINSGLASPRHFLTPTANFDPSILHTPQNTHKNYQLFLKYRGHNWKGSLSHTPLDVIAWHGNSVPYKYDLRLFTSINSVSHDHPDPSIFTMLTSLSSTPGTPNMDFVIFPPRWSVSENTFRPPWFHRNYMSELMGLISGQYEAKQSGFTPGGVSLHNQFVAHGPDYSTWKNASEIDTKKPARSSDTMAFMVESSLVWHPTKLSLFAKQTNGDEWMQSDYPKCWSDLEKVQFDINQNPQQKIPFYE